MNMKKFIRLICIAIAFMTMASACWAQFKISKPSSVFRTELASGRHPWYGQNFHNQPQNFQFVILCDRTGGNQRGIFEETIPRINQLRPEFVISIGDLIDGYTENDSLINWQWRDLETAIAPLEMPLFMLPGNHDISNPRMRRVWEKRFGTTYYHFIYRDVLFLMINSEDPPYATMGQEQVDYFSKILATNTQVRWTLVFLHEPLWTYENPSGYAQLDALLKNRPHTVIAGHTHQYRKTEADGVRRYIVATTGGGSGNRGAEFGEFHHIVWVTMSDAGPLLVNLEVSGILPDDIVSDANFTEVQTLRDGAWMQVKPAVSRTHSWQTLDAEILFQNPTTTPLHIRADWPAQQGIQFTPQQIDTLLPPGGRWPARIRLSPEKALTTDSLAFLTLEATGSFSQKNSGVLTLPTKKRLLMETPHAVPQKSFALNLDGSTGEWPAHLWHECVQPQQVQEEWDWRGCSDGRFGYAITKTDSFLYFALKSFDDKQLFTAGTLQKNQDQFYIDVEMPGRKAVRLKVAPGIIHSDSSLQVKGACLAASGGLEAELRLPLPGWQEMRLNFGYMDHDQPFNNKPSILWWRPLWDGNLDYAASGRFHMGKE